MKNDLYAMFKKHPLGCKRFGAEWLRRWEGIGRLLQKPAQAEYWNEELHSYEVFYGTSGVRTAAACIETAHRSFVRRCHIEHRVVLLDGTIVKEWGPK